MNGPSGKHKLVQIVIIGAFPPPISGNGVHISRLYHLLKSKGYKVQIFDYYGKQTLDDPLDVIRLSGGVWSKAWCTLKFLSSIPRDAIIHFHVSAFGRFRMFAPVLLLATLFHKRVITIHSGSFVEEWQAPFKKLYLRMILSMFNILIVVSREIKEFVLSLNIKPGHIYIIPAYIREDVERDYLPVDFGTIPLEKTKIVTSGYLTRLYNYEILIKSIKHLDQEKFHFIFAFYGQYDDQYEAELMNLIKAYSNVTIYRALSSKEFLAVLDSSDVYVRTALRDGDSVAVREALDLGKVVYATDCVQRPLGCVVFRNTQDLTDQLRIRRFDRQIQKTLSIDGSQQILDLYESLNGGLLHAASSR